MLQNQEIFSQGKKKGGGGGGEEGTAIWEHSVAKKKKKSQNKTQTRKPYPSLFYFHFNVSLVIFPNYLYFPNIQVSSFSCTYFYAIDKQEILFFLLSITSFQPSSYFFFLFPPPNFQYIHPPPQTNLSSSVTPFFFPVLLYRNYFSVPFHSLPLDSLLCVYLMNTEVM